MEGKNHLLIGVKNTIIFVESFISFPIMDYEKNIKNFKIPFDVNKYLVTKINKYI